MVMSRRPVQLTTLFSWAVLRAYTFACKSQQPFLNQRKVENDSRNYFMINLHKSMGHYLDHTRGPWVCSQTRYQLCYGALGLMYTIKFIHLKSVYRHTILCIGLVCSLSENYECGTRLGFHILGSLTPTPLVAKAQSYDINLSWRSTTTCTSMCKFICSGKGVGWGEGCTFIK